MDAKKVINKLNDILRHEWTGVAQYSQAGFVITGLWREVYSGVFFENAEESFGHARLIGDKIVALGGVPTIERNSVQQTNDIGEMLQNSLDFESAAVRLYNEALTLADDDRALVVFLEDILKEEQDGVDDFTKLLRDRSTAVQDSDAGASKAG